MDEPPRGSAERAWVDDGSTRFSGEPRALSSGVEPPRWQSAPEPPRAAPRAAPILGGRYRLLERLGSGASGEVWAVEDLVVPGHAALKWLRCRPGNAPARAYCEIAALRLLRFPGVVRLLDQGVEDERPFFVMERVAGRPFPGRASRVPPRAQPRRRSWRALAETTMALLEVLARVHAAGVVHRDLKPANVLVDAGLPTILDFGISLWIEPGEPLAGVGEVAGTPRYLAPEQCRGEGVDHRADLYALGVMLFEALAGRPPHLGDDRRALFEARLRAPAPELRALAPGVPARVAEVVDRLLSIAPEERPRDAAEVLEALREAPGTRSSRHPRWLDALRAIAGARRGGEAFAPLPEEALRPLFAGPDRVHHLREDAARALHARTGGDPARVEAELIRWSRLGLARWDNRALEVTREALAWLAAELEPGREGRLLELLDGEQPLLATTEAYELARRLADGGELVAAAAVLREGLHALRRRSGAGSRASEELLLLNELVKVAFAESTLAALARALYEISRASSCRAERERLEALVRAGMAAREANAPDAFKQLAALPPFSDPELERWRHRACLSAAAAQGSTALLEEVSAAAAAWSERVRAPAARLCLLEAEALLRYNQGRFAEAAALHGEAVAGDHWLSDRIAATLNTASALLEAFQHERAAERAAEARALAAGCRHPCWEARAEWLLRAARYRMGEASRPDEELMEAAIQLGVPEVEALIGVTEAAVAFRAGAYDAALRLAGRATARWQELGRRDAILLSRALELACGAPAQGGEVEQVAGEAQRCAVTGIGIQVLGLLGRRYPEVRRSRGGLRALLKGIAPEHRRLRMDVLSVEEALRWASSPQGGRRPRATHHGDASR